MPDSAEVATLTEGGVAACDRRAELRSKVLEQINRFLTGVLRRASLVGDTKSIRSSGGTALCIYLRRKRAGNEDKCRERYQHTKLH